MQDKVTVAEGDKKVEPSREPIRVCFLCLRDHTESGNALCPSCLKIWTAVGAVEGMVKM